MTVLGKEGMPLRILSAKCTNGAVSVSMKALRQGAQRGAVINAVLPGDKPVGSFGDEIVLKTSLKKNPEIKIPVNGEVVGRVQVLPKTLYLNGPTGQSITLQAMADPAEGFEVTRAKSVKGQVNTKVKKNKSPDGKTDWQIVVSIPWLMRDGPIEDEVIVTTNDPEQPTFTIPVNGAKAKPPKPFTTQGQ